MDCIEDLGVLVNCLFSPSPRIGEGATKARWMLAFQRLSSPFLLSYSSMVHPQLETSVKAWAPALNHDIAELEKVQKLVTRYVPGLRHLSYSEWLDHLKPISLRCRRLRGDVNNTFKILKEVVAIDP